MIFVDLPDFDTTCLHSLSPTPISVCLSISYLWMITFLFEYVELDLRYVNYFTALYFKFLEIFHKHPTLKTLQTMK